MITRNPSISGHLVNATENVLTLPAPTFKMHKTPFKMHNSPKSYFCLDEGKKKKSLITLFKLQNDFHTKWIPIREDLGDKFC